MKTEDRKRKARVKAKDDLRDQPAKSFGQMVIDSLEEALADPASVTRRDAVLTVPVSDYDGAGVRAVRDALGASQNVFADFLGVSLRTIQAWEQGINSPQPIACRFLDEIRLNPEFWRARLRSMIRLRDA
jgi:putative transcriptional regulator